MASSSNQNAELLKAEGNAFHQARQYPEAYAKYSQAIKQNPKNPILWANRAASALAMKRYLDAVSDTQKAVQLDPKYAKAWGRQGTAYSSLCEWEESILAFNKAIDCLPADSALSAAEKNLKAQLEEGLKQAQDRVDTDYNDENRREIHFDSDAFRNMPWKRAMAMEKELTGVKKFDSSAFIILAAHRDFEEGLSCLNELQIKVAGDREYVSGKMGCIESMTNAIMRDHRVFMIDDPAFLDKYDKQMRIEAEQSNAWSKGGVKLVQAEAPKRLMTLEWGALRSALSVTVRGWIMRGFIESLFKAPGGAAEYISDALELCEWGFREWKEVPVEDKGVIFQPSFIRGIKRIYLRLLMESYSNINMHRNIEDIANLAREVINDSPVSPPPPVEGASYNSFWTYPKADATLGWYFWRKALKSSNYDEATELFKESATHYIEGANIYASDDELHAKFLRCGLEAYWFAKCPLKDTLPIAKQFLQSIPAIKKIWEFSADFSSEGTGRWITYISMFERRSSEHLRAGRKTLEDTEIPHAHIDRPKA